MANFIGFHFSLIIRTVFNFIMVNIQKMYDKKSRSKVTGNKVTIEYNIPQPINIINTFDSKTSQHLTIFPELPGLFSKINF